MYLGPIPDQGLDPWIAWRERARDESWSSAMRAEIAPGGTFPDYELTDHAKTRRKLSELQGDDPMILVLARGHYCPRDNQQHLGLVAGLPEDRGRLHPDRHDLDRSHRREPRVPGLDRRPMDLPLRSRPQGAEGPRHPGVHRPHPRPDDPAHPRAQAGARDPQHLQRLLVLGQAVDRRALARPSRGVASRSGPTGTSSAPGLRETWDAGDRSKFYDEDAAAKLTNGGVHQPTEVAMSPSMTTT